MRRLGKHRDRGKIGLVWVDRSKSQISQERSSQVKITGDGFTVGGYI